jgi:hypothetical protein
MHYEHNSDIGKYEQKIKFIFKKLLLNIYLFISVIGAKQPLVFLLSESATECDIHTNHFINSCLLSAPILQRYMFSVKFGDEIILMLKSQKKKKKKQYRSASDLLISVFFIVFRRSTTRTPRANAR